MKLNSEPNAKLGLVKARSSAKGSRRVSNHHDGGRGVYFEDPNGHLLEIITRPYGSGE
jgi:catechol 2,3-dioxygenase-like lactoylglutathione lyase family enzyme